MKKLEDALSDDAALHAPLHEIERMLEAQRREMLRAMMQAHFDLRSAQECRVEVRDVDGVERTKIHAAATQAVAAAAASRDGTAPRTCRVRPGAAPGC